MNQPAEPPEPAVVEWGGARGVIDRLVAVRGWHPAVPRVLGGLGAVAMFGSLVGEWQVVTQRFQGEVITSDSFRIGRTVVWGVAWLVGATLLAICAAVALAGQPPLRRHTRAVGLAAAGVQLGILAAAAVNLHDESLFVGLDADVELSLGNGVYAAFASVLLIGVALYVARTDPTQPAAGDGPADLAVGPAEPMVRPTDTLQG